MSSSRVRFQHLKHRRFFKSYRERPATAQQKDVLRREALLTKLHKVEGSIYDISSKIYVELRHVVTYAGIPIKEKMKYDYSEMIKKVENDRKLLNSQQDLKK